MLRETGRPSCGNWYPCRFGNALDTAELDDGQNGGGGRGAFADRPGAHCATMSVWRPLPARAATSWI